MCCVSGIPNLPLPRARRDRTPRIRKHLFGQVRGTSHGSSGSSRGVPPSPPTRASVSPGAEQDEQAQPHPGSFGTDPCVAVNTGKGPRESPLFLLPLHPEGSPAPPCSRDGRSPCTAPTGLARGFRRSPGREGGPGGIAPVSPWVGGAIGGGQRAAWRVPQLCRRPAPRARRSPSGRAGTGHRPGADPSGVRPVPAPGRPVRSSTDRFSVMGRVRVRLPWGGMGFTAGFLSRSGFLSQIPGCIPSSPLPVPRSPQPTFAGTGTPQRFPQPPEHPRSDGGHQERHPQAPLLR